jgi:hypothetical protein
MEKNGGLIMFNHCLVGSLLRFFHGLFCLTEEKKKEDKFINSSLESYIGDTSHYNLLASPTGMYRAS